MSTCCPHARALWKEIKQGIRKKCFGGIRLKKALLALAVMLIARSSLLATSYYTDRLDDARAVYLTRDKFPVHADGVADDSDALQAAINKVQETTIQGILFLPSGRYRITRTIYIWPGIRAIGYGKTRPVLVLGANTPGYQQGLSYMIFFAGDRPEKGSKLRGAGQEENTAPPDANPGDFLIPR